MVSLRVRTRTGERYTVTRQTYGEAWRAVEAMPDVVTARDDFGTLHVRFGGEFYAMPSTQGVKAR